jgi:hypothetical protein
MDAQLRFSEVLVEIGTDVFGTIEKAPACVGKKWVKGILDVRYDEGGSSISKLRVHLDNGDVVKSIHKSTKAEMLLMELWDLRKDCLNNSWYGIIFTLAPSGECKSDFNSDPQCIEEKGFFTS